MARLEGEAFLEFVAGEFEQILVVVDASAVVVEDCSVRRIELEGAIELDERFVIHSVATQSDAGDHVDVPIIRGGRKQVGDAVTRGLFLAAGEEHVDAVEVRFDCDRIESESFIEGASSVHYMDLTSEAVANVLEFGDAKTSPARRKFGVLLRDTGEE